MKDSDGNGTGAYCPSSAPEISGSVILGVVSADEDKPRIAYASTPVPVTDEILSSLGSVSSGEVLRIAAPCQEDACPHFRDAECTLITKIVRTAPEPPPGSTVPRCYLRSRCRWWRQEKVRACMRCPMILTNDPAANDIQRWASDPANSVEDLDPRDFPGSQGQA
jgi:hypothetical protein